MLPAVNPMQRQFLRAELDRRQCGVIRARNVRSEERRASVLSCDDRDVGNRSPAAYLDGATMATIALRFFQQ